MTGSEEFRLAMREDELARATMPQPPTNAAGHRLSQVHEDPPKPDGVIFNVRTRCWEVVARGKVTHSVSEDLGLVAATDRLAALAFAGTNPVEVEELLRYAERWPA